MIFLPQILVQPLSLKEQDSDFQRTFTADDIPSADTGSENTLQLMIILAQIPVRSLNLKEQDSDFQRTFTADDIPSADTGSASEPSKTRF